jgi:hypothetical protein
MGKASGLSFRQWNGQFHGRRRYRYANRVAIAR